jgi:hypothetical protein
LEGEILVTPLSHEAIPWFRPRTSEYFPTPGFTTPRPIIVVSFTEREIFAPSSPVDFYPNPLLFPFPHGSSVPVSHVQTPSPLGSPPNIIPMTGVNPPRNIMNSIVVARYAPLIFPQLMNVIPAGDYLKYMPKFTREEDITIEEHLVSFYNYADNINIENKDLWM